jgi:dolichol-phosphate mannosyltransferase
MTNRLLVCIPTYNERENIERLLTRLFAQNCDVDALVIDDNSPDGTAEIVQNLQKSNSRLHLIVNPTKAGLGGAYRTGFRWALENSFDYVVEMDADGSHQPEQLQNLIEKCRSNDLVIGSRWVDGGSVVNWPLSRKILSISGNFYVRSVLGISIKDATAGYRIYSKEALLKLRVLESQSQGYIFQVDGTYRAVKNNLRVCEVPIEFVEREVGTSKMSKAIVIEAILQVTLWAFKHRILRKPLT